MKWKGKQIRPASPMSVLLLLALFFVLGLFLGRAVSGRVNADSVQELKDYMLQFLRLEECGLLTASAVFSTFILYVRYPLLALFFGCAAIGVVLLPVLTIAFGFFLSYAVSCFVGAFGKDGVLLAMAALGFRCIVSIPCYFLILVPAWQRSAALMGVHVKRSLGSASCRVPIGYWKTMGMVGLVLLLGVCLDLYLTPWLLRLSLKHVFI